MYQVLLVDDEPLILSGIKFMIDWQKNDCQIADTARNGQQALEKLRRLHPDIVICDIAMPGMTGTELLKQAAEEFPDIVFIMLTNHPDFQLAQHSLRYHAVDYLLKSDLDPTALEEGLAHAKAACDARAKLNRVQLVDDYLSSNRRKLLEKAFLSLVQSPPGTANAKASNILAENGVLDHFAAAYLPLDFTDTDWESSPPAERAKLLAWVQELCEGVAAGSFARYVLFSSNTPAQSQTLYLLCWQLEDAAAWQTRLRSFAEKAAAGCRTIAKTGLAVLGTDCFAGPEELEPCRYQVFALRDYHYYMDSGAMFFREFAPITWQPLALRGVGDQLTADIRAKNAPACEQLLTLVMDRVRTIPHQQGRALWLCGSIYSAAAPLLNEEEDGGKYGIELLTTRTQVLAWLEKIRTTLAARLGQSDPAGRTALLEKARQYVRDNVDKRIMLQDAADYVCLSPGYLSALFKKQYNQNFVDFINAEKCRRACELIQQGQHRIYEISYMLGFENAYYFSRVFKRHIGVTPTEYQKSRNA